MKNRFYIAAACILVLFLACSCGLFKSEVQSPEPAASARWDRAFAQESGWTGGDVAASFMIPGHRVLWVFGDSFIGEVKDGRRVNSTLVNNSIAVHALGSRQGEAPPPEAIRFYWGPDDDSGRPTAWVRPKTRAGPDGAKTWYWPTGGGAVLSGPDGDFRLALFLILLEKKPGENSLWAFEVAGNALAIVDNVEEPADRWRARVIEIPFEAGAGKAEQDTGPEIEWGLAALPADGAGDVVYVYGARSVDAGRRDLVLARAPEGGIKDFGAWEFYESGVEWSETISDASTIVQDVASELSVDLVCGLAGESYYVMVYSEPLFGDRILVRVSASPEGPWSEAAPIYRVTEAESSKSFFTYAAKAHAGLSEPGTLLISYIVNSHDFFELVNNASIYRPRFITVSVSGLSLP